MGQIMFSKAKDLVFKKQSSWAVQWLPKVDWNPNRYHSSGAELFQCLPPPPTARMLRYQEQLPFAFHILNTVTSRQQNPQLTMTRKKNVALNQWQNFCLKSGNRVWGKYLLADLLLECLHHYSRVTVVCDFLLLSLCSFCVTSMLAWREAAGCFSSLAVSRTGAITFFSGMAHSEYCRLCGPCHLSFIRHCLKALSQWRHKWEGMATLLMKFNEKKSR